ncbi:RidA family protein [Sorangium sp. So ce394]
MDIAAGSNIAPEKSVAEPPLTSSSHFVFPFPSMRVGKLNPPGVHETPGYHHVTIVEAGRLAFLAGQCPLDPDGNLVGAGDPLAQADQVAANALAVLAAVGAQPADVVRSVIYVVSDDREVLGAVWQRLNDSALGPAFVSASTLLGVASLGFTGQLVEVDLTAALPG